MLNRLIIKNVYSISSCEIDFTKDKYKYLEDNINGDIVNPVAIYGHNGSGKSSILKAISQLIRLMVEPATILSPFVVNNFLFDKYTTSKKKDISNVTGSIELYFDLNNTNYNYFISTTSFDGIKFEYLKKDNEIIFERKEKNYIYNGKSQIADNSSPLVPTLRRLASSEINDETIQKVYSYISSFTVVNLPDMSSQHGFVTSKIFNNINYMDLLVNKADEVKEILKDYNEFPIYNISKQEMKDPRMMNQTRYFIEIEGDDFKGTLPFEFISGGMKNQSALLSILLSMPENSVLFIDEVEQALHPSAIRSFIEVIKKRNVQVFFSSHNTNILQILRPDQVYFANWSKGYSNYSRLSKIYPNIREINNIEKMYLSSLFNEGIKDVK